MATMMIFMAIIIALVLLLFFVAASNNNPTFPSNVADMIDWSAIADDELQSYLPHQKINAIKRYRELTGVGLKEAKLAVEYVIANPQLKKIKTGLAADTGGAGVRDLVLEGRDDEAVDVYAAFMGVDEFTAREAIADLRRQINAEAKLSDDAELIDIRQMLDEGRKIEAIKHYMLQTGLSLAESKRAIEEME